MPRPTPPAGPHPALDGPLCVRLFDEGHAPAAIARRFRVSKQAVSSLLRAAGRDPAARQEAARAAERERFRAAWGAAADLGAPARALGLTAKVARDRAACLRRTGVPLKRMPRRSLSQLPRPKAKAIARLHRRGVPVAEIVCRTGASRAYAVLVLGRLRGRSGPPPWSPDKLARLGTESDAALAARTGRTRGAVTARRTRLGVPAYRDRRRRA
jgi:hypothetical protein